MPVTTKYWDYEIRNQVDFYCQEMPLASGFCIFHDKDYLQDKTNYEEHKRKILDRFKHKANDAISNKKPLVCIGFQLPDFSLSALSNNKEFTKPVYFSGSRFFGNADFSGANFQGKAFFSGAKFQGEADFHETSFEEAYFSTTEFKGLTNFQYVNFGDEDKILFDRIDLSNVSFNCTDISRIRFGGNVEWGGKKVKEDEFKIVDERQLEKEIKEKDGHTTKDSNLGLGSIIGIYRDLRKL